MRMLGIGGMARMLGYLAKDRALRKAMVEYARLFAEGEGFFGYGYFVGRKGLDYSIRS
jgi:hypothetical protein